MVIHVGLIYDLGSYGISSIKQVNSCYLALEDAVYNVFGKVFCWQCPFIILY